MSTEYIQCLYLVLIVTRAGVIGYTWLPGFLYPRTKYLRVLAPPLELSYKYGTPNCIPQKVLCIPSSTCMYKLQMRKLAIASGPAVLFLSLVAIEHPWKADICLLNLVKQTQLLCTTQQSIANSAA